MSVSVHFFPAAGLFSGGKWSILEDYGSTRSCITMQRLLSSKPCNFSLLDPFRFGGLGEFFFLLLEHSNEMLLSIKCAILLKADMKQASSSRQLRLVNQYFSTDLFMPLISIPVLEI